MQIAIFLGHRSGKLFCCGALAVLAFLTMAGLAVAVQSTNQGPRLSAANTKFAVDLYKRQTSATDENIFVSPLSISVVLAMTYLGAGGETKSQMKEVLHFNDVEDDQLHKAFADIQSELNKPQDAVKLYMANRLFAEKSYTFRDEFIAAGLKFYAAQLAPVDFR